MRHQEPQPLRAKGRSRILASSSPLSPELTHASDRGIGGAWIECYSSENFGPGAAVKRGRQSSGGLCAVITCSAG